MKTIEVGPGEDYMQAVRRCVEEVPVETKKEIRQLLIAEGLKVGDICERVQLETMIVAQIICDNITSAKMFAQDWQ